MSTAKANKALVKRLVDEVINAGDEDALDEICAPELAGRTRRVFGSFRSAFPDWREEIVDIVAEDDRVAGRFRCHGTHRGKFAGAAPTGRRMAVDEVFFLRVEDGRFVGFWALEDERARFRQLGLARSPARPPEAGAADHGRRGGGGHTND